MSNFFKQNFGSTTNLMELFKFGKKKMTKFISQYFDLLLNLTDDWQVTDISTHFKLKEIRLTLHI